MYAMHAYVQAITPLLSQHTAIHSRLISFQSLQFVLYIFLQFSQVELENWVNSIHSACAAAFARHRGKTGTLHLLQEEIFRLEKSIESVSQL